MSRDLYSIWEDLDNESFYLEEEKVKFKKEELNILINKLEKNLQAIANLENRKVFLDIKDRKTFIIAFFTLLKIGAKSVLVPTEIKTDDYIYNGGLFLSDNKENNIGIFIKKDMSLKLGDDFDSENLEAQIKDKIALYLYTSGSTGKAKLIPKATINLISELQELKNILSISENDIFYFTPPLYHIYGMLFGLLLPIYSSAKLIIDYNFTPESIVDFVSKNKITHFVSIPSYYRMFTDLNLINAFAGCKVFLSSSAPMPLDVSKSFFEKKLNIIEIYGSTETGGIAYRTSAINLEWKLFSYVKVIKKWEDYLDAVDRESINKQIELRIVSPAISVDYNKEEGFNTGDIVDLNTSGSFMLLGRNTRFVKISGKRVDLNYVQEKFRDYLFKMTNLPVKEEDIFIGEKDEKIYIFFEREVPRSSQEIKNDLKKILPGYAVPRIIINQKIPRNSMGKINKNKINEIIEKIL